ncbi:MAG: DUF4262 domain-containing protein [Nocardioidaceae bacterium]
MLDARTTALLDQEDSLVSTHIREHGWHITAVNLIACACCGEEPDDLSVGFAYTVGLFGLGHPELLIFSVPAETAAGVLNELGERVRAGANFLPGELLEFETWPHRIVSEEVPNPGDIVFCANRHYQRPSEVSVPVLQLTYDDKAGRFPWDVGYANAPELQPRPGTFQA